MAQEFISEYGLDSAEYVRRLADLFLERCPELSDRTVEEAIFVDEGPVEYLVWFVLDDYEDHTFICHDDDPNPQLLRRLVYLSPSEGEMSLFKAFLRKQYDVYRELETARLLQLPDTYLPQLGERPRANLALCHNLEDDRIVTGVSGTPRHHEQEIFEDISKIVPDRDLEKFVSKTVWTLNRRIEEEADRHTISADVRDFLEQDDDFRLETTKPVPSGIHPKYTDAKAELWQKPASKAEYVTGSQGFVQIWIPTDEDEIALVSATAGEYDRDAIVDSIREEVETAVA